MIELKSGNPNKKQDISVHVANAVLNALEVAIYGILPRAKLLGAPESGIVWSVESLLEQYYSEVIDPGASQGEELEDLDGGRGSPMSAARGAAFRGLSSLTGKKEGQSLTVIEQSQVEDLLLEIIQGADDGTLKEDAKGADANDLRDLLWAMQAENVLIALIILRDAREALAQERPHAAIWNVVKIGLMLHDGGTTIAAQLWGRSGGKRGAIIKAGRQKVLQQEQQTHVFMEVLKKIDADIPVNVVFEQVSQDARNDPGHPAHKIDGDHGPLSAAAIKAIYYLPALASLRKQHKARRKSS